MIKIKPSHKGLLKEGEKIPASKLEKASKGSSPAERKEAAFAKAAKSWNHSGHHAGKTRRRTGA